MGYGQGAGKKQTPTPPYKKSGAKGRSKNPCTICGEPGIPGLIQGAGKCQYHWNAWVWGEEYADRVKGEVK